MPRDDAQQGAPSGRLSVGETVRRLAGEYQVLAVHGEGGFGTAFRGTRVEDGAPVVLKELRIDRLKSWKALDLFEREAAVLKSLSHPRIPAFHDFFAREPAQGDAPAAPVGSRPRSPLRWRWRGPWRSTFS
jgi:serine/threonine protein kinase